MWQRITTDQFILQTIQGYRLEFFAVPQQVVAPVTVVKGLTQQNVMQEEIEKLLLKGAIQLVSPSNGQFVSRLFLVPKKTGDLRPVINLRPLNKFIIRKHFKMENLQNVTQLVRKGDYMVTIDLKDAYFSIPIHQSHRKFLRFSWRNQLFQFAALPFGLTSAPRVFTKVLKPVIASMRQRGIRCLIYIDDLIIVASSKMECNEQAVFAVQLLTDLGFNVNMEKSNLVPKTRVEFLGFVLDSIRMELFLPEKKKENILQRIRNLLMSRQILVRQVSSMVGLMQSAKWAVMPAVIYYRFLQRDLNSALEETGRDYDSLIMLSQEARQELKMWLTNLEMWHGRAMVMSRPSLIIQTDASLLGWGAVCLNTGKEANGLWSREETMLHINVLELMTAWFAIQTLVNVTTGAHVRFQMDNTTAVSYINKQGGTKSCQMVIIAKKIWDWAIKHQVQVSAEHLPGKQNVTADKLSRELNDNLEWSLDREVFCKLIRKAGFRPQVDLFATRLNAQVQKFVSWKPDPQAWKVDAFAITWTGIKAYAFSSVLSDKPPVTKSTHRKYVRNVVNCTSMEDSAMVSNSVKHVGSQTNSTSTESRFASASAFQRGTSSSDHETSRLAVVSQHLSDKGISDEAAELILASWRTGTEQQYSGAWRQWVSWCDKRKSNPLSASIGTVSQFLTSLYASGLSYSTVNTYRSAISMTHLPIDGVPVGSHYLIKRLMKGIFNKRPPVPRYVISWPVEKVLRYLKIMPGYDQISLKLLTWKTVILIALVSADRGDAIAALSTEYMIKDSEGYHFLVSKPTKCTRPGRGIKQIDLPKFTKDRRICVVYCLDKYLRATKRLRVDKQLFISYVKPHRSVTRTSIARWIKLIMQKSGIDVSIFQPHSTRSASTSTAFQQGVSVPDILKKADWSNASVFHRFYNRPKVHADFAQAILSVK